VDITSHNRATSLFTVDSVLMCLRSPNGQQYAIIIKLRLHSILLARAAAKLQATLLSDDVSVCRHLWC